MKIEIPYDCLQNLIIGGIFVSMISVICLTVYKIQKLRNQRKCNCK